MELSYFPGCSMVTTAQESNLALMNLCGKIGLRLMELEDWNCCGSSAAHCLDPEIAFRLAARNLSLATSQRPLLVMCPTCLHRLKLAHKEISEKPEVRAREEDRLGRALDPGLRISHFFEILSGLDLSRIPGIPPRPLQGLKVVSYYGCMLARPPSLRKERNYHGVMEGILSALGAEALPWPYQARCCGTFLSAARPDIATPLVEQIVSGALKVGAECIVTACAMCQLNLEIRCALKTTLPTLHFSEILAIALGERSCKGWFRRHLVDPRPLLRSRGLIL